MCLGWMRKDVRCIDGFRDELPAWVLDVDGMVQLGFPMLRTQRYLCTCELVCTVHREQSGILLHFPVHSHT